MRRLAPLLLCTACNSILGIPEPSLVSGGGNPDAGPRIDAPIPDARGPDATPDARVMFALTVNKPAAAGNGTVASDVGLSCAAECTTTEQMVELGTSVNLEARPAAGSMFAGWEGACTGIYRFCSTTMDQARTVTARFAPNDANIIFTTSQRMAADFGGLGPADLLCDRLAKGAGLSGHFVPALSIDGMSFKDRLVVPGMGVPPRGFVRLDGLPIADTAADLFAAVRLWYPVRFDENGLDNLDFVWTGTDRTGITYAEHTCSNWTSRDSSLMGVWGGGGGGPGWLNDFWSGCNATAPILCVQVDNQKVLSAPAPMTGKRLWVSKASFSPGSGGILAANNLCGGEKPAGATSVKALLPTTSMAASELIKPGELYVRPDGVPLGLGSDLTTPRMLSGPWVHGDGSYANNPCCIIRGSNSFTSKPSSDQNCMNWTSNSTSLKFTHGELQTGLIWQGDGTFFDCSSSLPIYCVEE